MFVSTRRSEAFANFFCLLNTFYLLSFVGRKLEIGGASYKKYVKKGYTPDFATGVLSPPESPYPPQPPGS